MLIILYHYIKTLIGYIITRKTTIYCKNCLISSLKVLLMHFITKQIKLCFLCTYNNQLDQVAWKLLAINFWQLMKLSDCYITKLLFLRPFHFHKYTSKLQHAFPCEAFIKFIHLISIYKSIWSWLSHYMIYNICILLVLHLHTNF